MKALLVHLNGTKLCLAGRVSDWPFYTYIEILHNPGFGKDAITVAGRGDNDLGVWAINELKVGDEIVIRIVNADQADEPLHYVPALQENCGPRPAP